MAPILQSVQIVKKLKTLQRFFADSLQSLQDIKVNLQNLQLLRAAKNVETLTLLHRKLMEGLSNLSNLTEDADAFDRKLSELKMLVGELKKIEPYFGLVIEEEVGEVLALLPKTKTSHELDSLLSRLGKQLGHDYRTLTATDVVRLGVWASELSYLKKNLPPRWKVGAVTPSPTEGFFRVNLYKEES